MLSQDFVKRFRIARVFLFMLFFKFNGCAKDSFFIFQLIFYMFSWHHFSPEKILLQFFLSNLYLQSDFFYLNEFLCITLDYFFFKRKISGLLTSFCLFTYTVFLHVNVKHEFTSKVLITRGSSQSPTKSSGRVWDEARSGVWNLTPVKSAVGRELCARSSLMDTQVQLPLSPWRRPRSVPVVTGKTSSFQTPSDWKF